MPTNQSLYQLHLFTLRIWQEQVGDNQWEWRGEVKNANTGERHYFRDWQVLAGLMPKILPQPEETMKPDQADRDSKP